MEVLIGILIALNILMLIIFGFVIKPLFQSLHMLFVIVNGLGDRGRKEMEVEIHSFGKRFKEISETYGNK